MASSHETTSTPNFMMTSSQEMHKDPLHTDSPSNSQLTEANRNEFTAVRDVMSLILSMCGAFPVLIAKSVTSLQPIYFRKRVSCLPNLMLPLPGPKPRHVPSPRRSYHRFNCHLSHLFHLMCCRNNWYWSRSFAHFI